MITSLRHQISARIFLLLLGILFSTSLFAADTINSGEMFPQIALPAPMDQLQRSYLGLTDEQPFTLNQIDARVALVEILNVHCPHCIKQTQPYNKLYRMIEADPETRGQIKMLGVAVANDDEAIDDFVVIYSVAFPVIPDRNFKLHSALRAGPTPFSVYAVRNTPRDLFVVTDTHLGGDDKIDELFDYLKDLLSMDSAEFTSLPQTEKAAATELLPPQSEAEINTMVKTAFGRQGQNLHDFRKLDLPSDRWVYSATLERNGQRQPIFAEVANRSAICDVCHSVHFFYLFDRSGLILDFIPLQLTKYGNVEWNKGELNYFSRRVIGKHLADSWAFSPKTDAVTSATMTSAIIFDDLGQGLKLLEELQQEKLLEP
ncbi:AhpC/TSA family protein [Desulfuromusa kysingii]|uniref:AhpC/TSA family protein n=1 Tax=Desulfuromusa kysingii TaxID=37625 RepID=A0A1H3X2P8_9BACT|nr:redoxin domain-containing protein [Desulfuromusa kysingii]SDZ93530.1 AhpC/TSA family protein [Desulfuromusa kysingii]